MEKKKRKMKHRYAEVIQTKEFDAYEEDFDRLAGRVEMLNNAIDWLTADREEIAKVIRERFPHYYETHKDIFGE